MLKAVSSDSNIEQSLCRVSNFVIKDFKRQAAMDEFYDD